MTFDFYSIGDAEYLYRVFTAVKMIANGGGITRLGMIGALLGLLVIGFRAIVTAGREFPLQEALVSWFVFMILFTPRANVAIEQMYSVPGVRAGEVYVVSDVPWGVAAVTSMMSQLGHATTDLMETAFGSTTEARVSSGGYATAIEQIAFLRWLSGKALMANPKTQPLLLSLTHYLSSCTVDGLNRGEIDSREFFQNPDVLEAITLDQEWITTATFLDASGGAADESTVTCRDGAARLRSASTSSEFLAGINEILKPHMGGDDAIPPLERAQNAFGALSATTLSSMSDYVMAGMVHTVWGDAKASSVLNMHQNAATLMLEQASHQRAVQWAAEDTMFRRIMRPMMTFFEALVPALAPIVAFVVGFGRMGIGLGVKYLVLSLWVAMWLPVLAISNLWLSSTAERFFALFAQETAPTSLEGMSLLMSEATDWLGTAGMIASATPMLTLSLLYGGAYTATALASRLQGGDHVNEKLMSPDAAQAAPALAMSPAMGWSPTSGALVTGAQAMLPKFSFRDEFSRGVESAASASHASSASWVDSLANARSGSSQLSSALSSTVSSSQSHMASWGNGRVLSLAREQGWSDRENIASSLQMGKAVEAAMNAAVGGNLVLVKANLQAAMRDGASVSDSAVTDLARSLSAGARASDDFKADTGRALMRSVQAGESEQLSRSLTESENAQLQRSTSEAFEERATFNEAQRQQQSVSVGADLDLAQASQRALARLTPVEQEGIIARARSHAINLPGTDTLEANSRLAMSAGIADPAQARLAGALMTLGGIGVEQGDATAPAGAVENRGAAYLQTLQELTPMGEAAGAAIDTAGARSNAGLSGHVDHGTAARVDGAMRAAPAVGALAAGGAALRGHVAANEVSDHAIDGGFHAAIEAGQAVHDRNSGAVAGVAASGFQDYLDEWGPEQFKTMTMFAKQQFAELDQVKIIPPNYSPDDLARDAADYGARLDLNDSVAETYFGYRAVGAQYGMVDGGFGGLPINEQRDEHMGEARAQLERDPYWTTPNAQGVSRLAMLDALADAQQPEHPVLRAIGAERASIASQSAQ